jgi:hypothetical protein
MADKQHRCYRIAVFWHWKWLRRGHTVAYCPGHFIYTTTIRPLSQNPVRSGEFHRICEWMSAQPMLRRERDSVVPAERSGNWIPVWGDLPHLSTSVLGPPSLLNKGQKSFSWVVKRPGYGVNPLTPELNPSAQRCLPRFFIGDFNF